MLTFALSIGSCFPLQFQCASGDCITRSSVCNNAKECTSGSDEIGCGMFNNALTVNHINLLHLCSMHIVRNNVNT